MKRGDKVSLRLQADVIAVREHEPKFMIQLLPYGAAGAVGLHVSTDEIVDPSADWREICADMIRLGRDREAVALLVEKAPHVTPYIKALEGLVEAFSHLPDVDSYKEMARLKFGGPFGGKLQIRDEIERYEAAATAWKRALDARNGVNPEPLDDTSVESTEAGPPCGPSNCYACRQLNP